MRSAATQAVALAAMLRVATGGDPRSNETADRIRIEADIPSHLRPARRAAILTALQMGARYGHVRSADGETVWAEIDTAERTER